MRPLDITTLETQLRAAIDAGNAAEITRLGDLIDRHERDNPKAVASLASAALWYASAGLRVFPLRAGSKIPHPGTHGCKDATTDETRIRQWWTDRPDSNIGIATGHLIDVVDVDGVSGQQSRVAHWDDIFGQVDADKVAVVMTPRPGGMHIYVPAQGEGNSASIVPSVDYRGAGGYVVAPPSVITEGDNPGIYIFLSAPRFNAIATAA